MGINLVSYLSSLPGLEGRVFSRPPVQVPGGPFVIVSEGGESTLERLLDGGELVTRSVTVELHHPCLAGGLVPDERLLAELHALALEAEEVVDEVSDGDLVGIFRLRSDRVAFDPPSRGLRACVRFALLVQRPAVPA